MKRNHQLIFMCNRQGEDEIIEAEWGNRGTTGTNRFFGRKNGSSIWQAWDTAPASAVSKSLYYAPGLPMGNSPYYFRMDNSAIPGVYSYATLLQYFCIWNKIIFLILSKQNSAYYRI
jgi:hypothetical protein